MVRGRLRHPWVVLLVLSLILPSAAGSPVGKDDLVEIFPIHASGYSTDCLTTDVDLIVKRTDLGWTVTIRWVSCAQAIWAQAMSQGFVMRLEGDWESGFVGSSGPGFFYTRIEIGAYGDGDEIPIWICFMCQPVPHSAVVVWATGTHKPLPI